MSSNIVRADLVRGQMTPCQAGDWVSYRDHQALLEAVTLAFITTVWPFAMLGGPIDDPVPAFHDLESSTVIYTNSGCSITAGDVRRARSALNAYRPGRTDWPQRFINLLRAVSSWKQREDGLVYSDEPLDSYLSDARALLKEIEG